jgi:DNA-binding XRE family transcriptional regulator
MVAPRQRRAALSCFDSFGDSDIFPAMPHVITDHQQFQAMIEGLSQHGMTSSEIARRIGCSRQQVWRLETGKCRNPSFELGMRLKQLHDKTISK